MLSPTVSVIIPTYNAQSTIIRVIESVLNQKFSNLEILIVDDKSTDKTVKTVKKIFPNLSIIELPENLGVANARNEGIRLSRGKYIAFLDSDDLWNEEKLLYQITFMERKNCDASCTYVEYGTFQDQGFVGSYIKEPEFVYSLDNYKDLLIDNKIITSSVVLKKSKIKNIKFPNLRNRQDLVFWCTLIKSGVNFYGLNKILVTYDLGYSGISSNKLKMLRFNYLAFKKILDSRIELIYYFTLNVLSNAIRSIK